MKPNLKSTIIKARAVDGIVYFHLSDGTYWCGPVSAVGKLDYDKWEKLESCPKALE